MGWGKALLWGTLIVAVLLTALFAAYSAIEYFVA
jgi:hypothetical protein